ALAGWEKRLAAPVRWIFRKDLAAHLALDGDTKDGAGGRAAKVEGGVAAYVPAPAGRAVDLDGKRFVNAGDVGDFGFYDKFSLAVWVRPHGRAGVILSRTEDTDRAEGYALQLIDGKVQFNLVKRWLDDALRVETVRALEPGRWHHVAATYDGSRVAAGARVYIDGRPQELRVHLDDLNQSFQTKQPLRVGAGGGPSNRFRGAVGDVRVYDRCLAPEEVELVATPDPVADIVAVPPAK